ncbi:DUF922 domain-containing Zn-dependent protease [Brucella pseudogrignonensis]|uniref:DUF922 domain-containing Zn-dependent protease n=1 Tax=Brucella pseudogrignonensis TaxID=419475 RepID=UPI00286BF924|nr:DUF922 domain-containing Zn-dependent protease [Brucella pseudogrignonensis]
MAVFGIVFGVLISGQAQAEDDWKAVEIIKPYAISGRTGPELYQSIGQKGPRIGIARVIAHTTYVLTWDRKFDNSNNGCTIVSAKPKLKITYTLPKPSQKLSSPVKENWEQFYEGIYKHELVHGETAKDMTREIVRTTVGLSIPNDPKCQKMRRELIDRINALVAVQRQQGRDFDRVEMGSGGNVEQLVLSLVNG